MTTARIFAVENKLAQIANEPGGRTIEQAVRAAETRIEAVRDVSLASLVEKVERMTAFVAAGRGSGDPAAFKDVYDLSNAIFGIASTFELKALADAAFSLCDLADCFRSGEPANWPAIDVHVDGIRLLANLGDKAGAAGADSILEGLRRVRARVARERRDVDGLQVTHFRQGIGRGQQRPFEDAHHLDFGRKLLQPHAGALDDVDDAFGGGKPAGHVGLVVERSFGGCA
jgi:hypothetical protein